MVTVERHAIDRDDVARRLEGRGELLDAILEGLRAGRVGLLTTLGSDAESWAGYHSALDADSPEVRRGLRLVAAAGEGIAVASSTTTGAFELGFGEGAPATLAATGPVGATLVGNWTRGYFAAAALGERAVLDRICAVPIRVLRQSPTNAQEALWLQAEALRALQVAPGELASWLKQAVEATDPSRITFAADYVLSIVAPMLELLYRLDLGDAPGFEDTLAFALQQHKRYWSTGKRRAAPEGFLALGPSALVRLARDRGLRVDARSPYLLV